MSLRRCQSLSLSLCGLRSNAPNAPWWRPMRQLAPLLIGKRFCVGQPMKLWKGQCATEPLDEETPWWIVAGDCFQGIMNDLSERQCIALIDRVGSKMSIIFIIWMHFVSRVMRHSYFTHPYIAPLESGIRCVVEYHFRVLLSRDSREYGQQQCTRRYQVLNCVPHLDWNLL